MVDVRKAAGVYGRQSHGKQTSVDDQLRLGCAWCEQESWPVHRRYRDKVSASPYATKSRDGWPELVADVDAGILGIVVMWEATRGDRTLETWAGFLALCKRQGVLIRSLKDERTYDVRLPRDWKSLAEDGVHAQFDSDSRSVDVRRGVEGALLAGKAHGRTAHGYTRVYDREDRKKFTEVPDEHAPVPREIVERIATRDPIVRIVADLGARGVWTPGAVARARNGTGVKGPVCGVPGGDSGAYRGCSHGSCLAIRGKWRPNTVRQIAQRPTYAGLRGHNGAQHPGNWEPIVAESIWREAQAVLGEPDRKTTAPGRFKWLLSYLAVSPHGGHLNRRAGRKGRRAAYACVEDGCVGVGVPELDEYITLLVIARLCREDMRDWLAAQAGDAEAARVAVAKIKAEHDELIARVDAEELSLEFAARTEPGILKRLKEARARLDTTTGHGAVLAMLGDGKVTSKRVRRRWELASVVTRRSVIAVVVERITVHTADERASRWTSEEKRLRLAVARTEVTWRQ